jgi:hypothetical protein
MSRLKNNSRLNRELIATVRALAQTNASLRDFIKLAASKPQRRATSACVQLRPDRRARMLAA